MNSFEFSALNRICILHTFIDDIINRNTPFMDQKGIIFSDQRIFLPKNILFLLKRHFLQKLNISKIQTHITLLRGLQSVSTQNSACSDHFSMPSIVFSNKIVPNCIARKAKIGKNYRFRAKICRFSKFRKSISIW